MLGTLFSAVVGASVWGLANVLYYGMKRRGERGFGRFAAFWVGTPTTWITLFVVREERRPSFEVDDDAALLAEVRRDRALRDVGATTERDGDRKAVGGAGADADPASDGAVGPGRRMPSGRESR